MYLGGGENLGSHKGLISCPGMARAHAARHESREPAPQIIVLSVFHDGRLHSGVFITMHPSGDESG